MARRVASREASAAGSLGGQARDDGGEGGGRAVEGGRLEGLEGVAARVVGVETAAGGRIRLRNAERTGLSTKRRSDSAWATGTMVKP